MEQDIEILEDYIELIKKGYCEDCNELCNIYGAPTYPAKKISEATEHLIKAYKELEEENKDLKNLANKKQWISPCYVAQNYIPVSLTECIELDLNNNYQYNFISARQIKSIVTHEQFASIEYKVEEDK